MIAGILMSLNDHGWGNQPGGGNKGGNQGPPDLEELWRDFNRRLSGLLNRKGGGNDGGDGGNRMPSLSPRQFGGGIGLLAALVAVIWLASGFYIVDASQRGVVLQFGSFKETTEPGLRWRLPWPIQSHEMVNLSGVRTVEVGYRGSEKNKVLKEALMLTDDENIVSVQFAVQYLLKDVQAYLFKNRHPDDAVIQAAETAIREIVGKSKMDFVLYEGRDVIAASTQKLIQDILDRYETGIQVRSVSMQSTQPPEQVQAAFDDAVKAGQDKERHKNEGQAYANDVIPRAKGAASRLQQEVGGLPVAASRDRRGRCFALQADSGRIQQGAGGHPAAPLSGDRAAGLCQHQQGDGRCQGQRQLALPATRQAHAGRGYHGRRGGCRHPRRRGRAAGRCGGFQRGAAANGADTRCGTEQRLPFPWFTWFA